ncbi:DUF2127 domain-containing protein [Geobacter argillaceus]|nr:DUF2127 domain-containing protein [Geobacter argillaceus]
MRKRSAKKKQPSGRALQIVALFEGAKGALVLVTGLGLLALIHRDVHQVAEQLVRHLHFNPARHYPRIFLDAADRVTDPQLWALALAALFYSAIRFAEAVGLWLKRRWAEWFGFLSGGMYIPVELYEVLREATWPRVTVLVLNLAIVLYLLGVLIRTDRR